ncbi:serine/threonine protein kinase, partial [Micromonospora sp. NPDC023633]
VDRGTRTDAPVAATVARRKRRGTLVGAAAAVLVALGALGAALGMTSGADAPAVKVPQATTPAAEPSGSVEAPAEQDDTPVDPARPVRPAGSTSSPSPSATAPPVSPQPSRSAAPESPEPTKTDDAPEPTPSSSPPTQTTPPVEPTETETTPPEEPENPPVV